MLTIAKLNAKRRRKEIKRKAVRLKAFLGKVKQLRGNKRKLLKARAMQMILTNPGLYRKYMENKQKTEGTPEVLPEVEKS